MSQGELFSQRALALLWDGARDPTVNIPQREGEVIPGLPRECLAQMRKEICVGLLVVDMNDFMSRTPPKELGDGCTVRIGEQCSHRTELIAYSTPSSESSPDISLSFLCKGYSYSVE